MKNFDAVIFDMDGVIFDSEQATMNCWKEIAQQNGLENAEEVYLATLGTNMKKTREIVLSFYGQDFPFETCLRDFAKLYYERYGEGRLPMKPGVRELFRFLKENHKKIALASSTKRNTVIRQLRDADLFEFFDEIVTGDMVTRSKPAPDISLLACSRLGSEPEHTYVIEDSYSGIQAAHTGGLSPIMVPDLLPADDEMIRLCESVEDSLNDVILYLTQ